MLNKIVMIGRLTKNPEIKNAGEIPKAGFTLAVDRPYKSEKGQNADFIPVTVWRKSAEFVQRYFTKGKQVYVAGRLETYVYEVDGQRRYGFRVNAEEVGFADTKHGENDGAGIEPLSTDDLPVIPEEDLPF